MKKITLAVVLASLSMTIGNPAVARNEAVYVPLADAVQLGIDQGKLDGSVKFYLSGAATPRIASRLGEDSSNKKTNSVGKDDATACKWAALSALIAFQNKAKSLGANAVVDLHSNNNRVAYKNPTNFECRAGNIIAGTAFKGTYAKTH